MFDAIARRYDRLNHLLSAGLDRRWRRRAIRELALTGRERVLDVCTGTGDLAIEAATSSSGRAREVVGVDFSGEMLRLARAEDRGGVAWRRTSGSRAATRRACPCPTRRPTPRPSRSASATSSIPLRPAASCIACCVPGGRLAILEFGAPRIPGVRTMYLWYFKYLLPVVGRAISKHSDAYSYLPASVMDFPAGEAFGDLLRSAGFANIRSQPLTFGIVWLYIARKEHVG